MACAQGALSKLCVKEGSGNLSFASGTVIGIPFARENLAARRQIGHPDVIIGSREEVSERARFSPWTYGGWFNFHLSPAHAETIFPWVLGADANVNAYELAETLQAFSALADKVTGVHEFHTGYINRIRISGRQNGPGGNPNWITVAVQCVFMGYLAPGSSEAYPSLTLPVTGDYAPYVFEDGVLTLSSAVEVKSFVIDINNHIQPRYVNNLEPTALCPSRRTITLSTVHPYDSGTSALYNLAITGVSGTKTLALTNGSNVVTFTFGSLQADTITPVVEGKQEIDLVMNMSARKVSTTPSLSVTIATP